MRVKFDLRNKLSIFFSIYNHPPCWPSAATHLGRVVQSWVKITQGLVRNLNSDESLKSKFSLILFVNKLMIGCS